MKKIGIIIGSEQLPLNDSNYYQKRKKYMVVTEAVSEDSVLGSVEKSL